MMWALQNFIYMYLTDTLYPIIYPYNVHNIRTSSTSSHTSSLASPSHLPNLFTFSFLHPMFYRIPWFTNEKHNIFQRTSSFLPHIQAYTSFPYISGFLKHYIQDVRLHLDTPWPPTTILTVQWQFWDMFSEWRHSTMLQERWLHWLWLIEKLFNPIGEESEKRSVDYHTYSATQIRQMMRGKKTW